MTCVVTSVTFLFLLATIGAETISFLTSYMVVNRYAPGLHDGIFQRCGAINFFLTAINSIGSFVSKHLDGTVDTFTSCYWWNSSLFRKDERSLQAVIIFTFISIGLLALAFILFLISLVNRFRTKQLNLFLGLLMLFNCLILISIILIYTFLYAQEAKITPDISTPLVYSWSYWILYAAASGSFLTGILFSCNQGKNLN